MGKWSEKVDVGDGSWGKSSVTDSKTEVIVGSDKSGGHCHLWENKEKNEVGFEHRGHCAECKDNESGGK
jgi:hypothetical protein